MTYTAPNGRTYKAKITNGRAFYWSTLAFRWLPCKRSEVVA